MTPRHKQPFFDANAKYFPALGAKKRRAKLRAALCLQSSLKSTHQRSGISTP